MLCFALGLVAEIERNLISMRTKEALALRKAEGVVPGRRKGDCPKMSLLSAHKQTVIRMLDKGNPSRRFASGLMYRETRSPSSDSTARLYKRPCGRRN